jgi:drug/metabolite transporter (DMT)-like permease
VGVIFIARPPFIFKYFDSSISGNYSDTNIVGVILSIASALLTAAGFVVIRRISRRAEPTQIVMMLSIVSSILALPCHAILPGSKWIVPNKWETYIWLVVVSVSSFAGQIFMCKSLAVESAARASSFQYIQVIFAYLFDLAVNRNIQITSIVGACIIGFSVLCIAFSKIQQAKRRLSANLMKAGAKLPSLIINKR